MQRMQIWVGLYSHYNASLPGQLSYIIQYLFLILHGYGYHTATVKNLVQSACQTVPGKAEPALAAWDTALIIAGNAADKAIWF